MVAWKGIKGLRGRSLEEVPSVPGGSQITRASCQEPILSLGMLSWKWKNGSAIGLHS